MRERTSPVLEVAMVRSIGSCLAGLALLAAASTASAEAADPVERVRALVQTFEYDAAIEQAEALFGDAGATAAQRLQALALSGAVRLLQNNRNDARSRFERVLSLDPGFHLSDPDLPPRVQQFFEEVRSAFEPSSQLTLTLDNPAELPPSGPLRVRATLSGPVEGVDQLVLNVREGGEGEFQQVTMTGAGLEYTAEVPGPAGGQGLELYVEARAPSGTVLASGGSADVPVSVSPAPSSQEPQGPAEEEPGGGPRRRWYRSWWFWTIVGTVVVGGTVAAVVVTTRPEEPQDGTLGSVQLPLLWPTGSGR